MPDIGQDGRQDLGVRAVRRWPKVKLGQPSLYPLLEGELGRLDQGALVVVPDERLELAVRIRAGLAVANQSVAPQTDARDPIAIRPLVERALVIVAACHCRSLPRPDMATNWLHAVIFATLTR